MKRKKVIFSVVGTLLLLIAIGGAWGWKVYHQSRTNIDASTDAIIVSASTLYDNYSVDEKVATHNYTDKVVAVSGIVTDVLGSNGTTAVLIDAGPRAMGVVNCTLASPDTRVHKGDYIVVKGRCLGYLMDVNIVDATIIPSQNNK